MQRKELCGVKKNLLSVFVFAKIEDEKIVCADEKEGKTTTHPPTSHNTKYMHYKQANIPLLLVDKKRRFEFLERSKDSILSAADILDMQPSNYFDIANHNCTHKLRKPSDIIADLNGAVDVTSFEELVVIDKFAYLSRNRYNTMKEISGDL